MVQTQLLSTGTSTNILTTADGYKWKFMYSISASDVIKFVTSDFIPVKTIGAKEAVEGDVGGLGSAVTDDNSAQWDVENATDGSIVHARVTAGGSYYGASDGNIQCCNQWRWYWWTTSSNSIFWWHYSSNSKLQ